MEKTIWVNGDEFILVDAESLSFDDDFIKFEPNTDNEKVTKELISEAISKGVKNFYRPKCDPSFTENGNGICFVPGKKPAVGKPFEWWKKKAKAFCHKHSSRLGTRLEYGAFLGVLIKNLVVEGKSVEWAWNAVCNDSRELGHYWNSEGALRDFEPTGSREVCGFCDLANAYKMLAEDEETGGCWLAGSCHIEISSYVPIVCLSHPLKIYPNCSCVGWLVLEK